MGRLVQLIGMWLYLQKKPTGLAEMPFNQLPFVILTPHTTQPTPSPYWTYSQFLKFDQHWLILGFFYKNSFPNKFSTIANCLIWLYFTCKLNSLLNLAFYNGILTCFASWLSSHNWHYLFSTCMIKTYSNTYGLVLDPCWALGLLIKGQSHHTLTNSPLVYDWK